MTVESNLMDKAIGGVNFPPSMMTEEFKINNENVSPCNGELMVAVKPSLQNLITPLISKTNISSDLSATKTTSNARSSPKGNKLIITQASPSPVKRPITVMDSLSSEAPSAKRQSIPTYLKSISSSSNNSLSSLKLLSQSAGSSSQLQSAISRVRTNLSQSCFADLRASRSSDIDCDLRSLNWLQEGDLINGFHPGVKKEETEADEKNEKLDMGINKTNDPLSSISEEDKSLRKPAYSFSTLIFMAIENAKDKRLPVKDIYQWIQDNFPYFQKAPIGWKNSVRHNLSLNKSFKKVDKEKCIGKGSLWTIDHEARAGLVQQLRKTTTYHSYPYSRTQYPHGCGKYLSNKTFYKRDIHGRFIPNHDDTEFDVAAAMCSMSSPAAFKSHRRTAFTDIEDSASSEELLKIWRTYIEPYDDEDASISKDETSCEKGNKFRPVKVKYSIEDFLDEVQNKLSFKSKHRSSKNSSISSPTPHKTRSLNTSMDEDYEFYDSDEESDEDDEMAANMKRLVEKEKDDGLCDSGFSEEGTFKYSTMLEHSYSKSINSLVKPHSKRESKGVAALLHLANAATKELESMTKKEKSTERNIQVDMDLGEEDLEKNFNCNEVISQSSPIPMIEQPAQTEDNA